jgi:hypothetical protein
MEVSYPLKEQEKHLCIAKSKEVCEIILGNVQQFEKLYGVVLNLLQNSTRIGADIGNKEKL